MELALGLYELLFPFKFHIKFQSLFSWNSPSDSVSFPSFESAQKFQSLFSWNSPSDPVRSTTSSRVTKVSILVFVELALGLWRIGVSPVAAFRFQSLFSWNSPSDWLWKGETMRIKPSFNPCFRGTRPRTAGPCWVRLTISVSILVFVELALGLGKIPIIISTAKIVSILVFVELALGHYNPEEVELDLSEFQSLFSWNSPSDGPAQDCSRPHNTNVSILVFVELALGL